MRDRGSYSISHLKNKTKIIRKKYCWCKWRKPGGYFYFLWTGISLYNSAEYWWVLNKTSTYLLSTQTKKQINSKKYFEGNLSEMCYTLSCFSKWFPKNLTWPFPFDLHLWPCVAEQGACFSLCGSSISSFAIKSLL